MDMPKEETTPTGEKSSDENKAAEEAVAKAAEAEAEADEVSELSDEEKKAKEQEELDAQAKADAEELRQLRDDNAALQKESQHNQSQVDKIKQGAIDKREQLEASLGDTEDPSEKLTIEKAIFDLDKGLFELEREIASGDGLTEQVNSTLKELGYAEDSEIAKKLLAIIASEGDNASAIIKPQLELLRLAGVRTAGKKEEVKLPASINADKQGSKIPDGSTSEVSAKDFADGGEASQKAGEKLSKFIEELSAKGI